MKRKSRTNQVTTLPLFFLSSPLVPFLRFLFIFLMRSLSSIAPSSYGRFRPRPGEKARREEQSCWSITGYERCLHEHAQSHLCVRQREREANMGQYVRTSIKMDKLADTINRTDRETSKQSNNEEDKSALFLHAPQSVNAQRHEVPKGSSRFSMRAALKICTTFSCVKKSGKVAAESSRKLTTCHQG